MLHLRFARMLLGYHCHCPRRWNCWAQGLGTALATPRYFHQILRAQRKPRLKSASLRYCSQKRFWLEAIWLSPKKTKKRGVLKIHCYWLVQTSLRQQVGNYAKSFAGKPRAAARKSPVNMAKSCNSVERRIFLGDGCKNVSKQEPFQPPILTAASNTQPGKTMSNSDWKTNLRESVIKSFYISVFHIKSLDQFIQWESYTCTKSWFGFRITRSSVKVLFLHIQQSKNGINQLWPIKAAGLILLSSRVRWLQEKSKIHCQSVFWRNYSDSTWFQPRHTKLKGKYLSLFAKSCANWTEHKEMATINLDWWIGVRSETRRQGRQWLQSESNVS